MNWIKISAGFATAGIIAITVLFYNTAKDIDVIQTNISYTKETLINFENRLSHMESEEFTSKDEERIKILTGLQISKQENRLNRQRAGEYHQEYEKAAELFFKRTGLTLEELQGFNWFDKKNLNKINEIKNNANIVSSFGEDRRTSHMKKMFLESRYIADLAESAEKLTKDETGFVRTIKKFFATKDVEDNEAVIAAEFIGIIFQRSMAGINLTNNEMKIDEKTLNWNQDLVANLNVLIFQINTYKAVVESAYEDTRLDNPIMAEIRYKKLLDRLEHSIAYMDKVLDRMLGKPVTLEEEDINGAQGVPVNSGVTENKSVGDFFPNAILPE